MEKSSNQLNRRLDILLVIPPPFWTKMPHLGVAYLDTFLKKNGVNCGAYDLNLVLYNQIPQELIPYWGIGCLNHYRASEISDKISDYFQEQMNTFVDDVIGSDIPIIGFSVNVISIFTANKIACLIKLKDKNRKIIFGGPAVFFKTHRKLINPCFADFFIIGEGEYTLLNLLKMLKDNKPIQNGKGILLGKDYDLYDMPPADPIPNLDLIPFPDFTGFNLQEYNNGVERRLPLLFSRGCIGRCSYCVDCIMWPKYRYRSPENIFQEIRYHIDVNKADAFDINDLACNGDIKQLSKFCNIVIESGVKIPAWASYALIRKDMNPEVFTLLKKANCHTLIYGLESGSDNVLKRMRKIYTAEDAQRIIRLTHEAGILTNVNIITGFPGERKRDFHETVDFIYRNRKYIDEVTNVSSFVLFPDADVGRNRDDYGIIWQEGTEPILCRDRSGLDYHKRAKRVEKMVKFLDDIGLRKAIINKPEVKKPVKSVGKNKENRHYCHSLFFKLMLIFFLSLFALVIEAYLYFAKKVRKTVVFPGG